MPIDLFLASVVCLLLLPAHPQSFTNLAAFPSVSDVHLKQKSSLLYSGTGVYYGGYEGSSLYKWYRESSDGTRHCIDGADLIIYEVTDADYSCRLLFG